MHPLKVESLTLQLPDGTFLCRELSFDIEPGEVLVLMGTSGIGKSTILSWLTGTLDKRIRSKGEVWLGETRLTNLPVEQRSLGLMLQQDYLFPHMTVGQNLKFGLRGGTPQERNTIVEKSLADAGLSGMMHNDPATLSGGQRARVSLLRSLLSNPCALLLDEPFSRLDVALREQIRNFTWRAAAQLPTLLVTHDGADVPAQARILELQKIEPLENQNLSEKNFQSSPGKTKL